MSVPKHTLSESETAFVGAFATDVGTRLAERLADARPAIDWGTEYRLETTPVDVGLLSLPSASASAIDRFLRLAVIVLLADVCLLYRWSEEAPTAFVRSHWFLILTVVPWFRPLRALRIGRGLRVFRTLSRSRRVGSLLHKLRRAPKRVRNR